MKVIPKGLAIFSSFFLLPESAYGQGREAPHSVRYIR